MAKLYGVERVLIVCPTSLKHQWEREIQRCTDRTVQIVGGNRTQRAAQFRTDSFYKITNYDTIYSDLDLIGSPDDVADKMARALEEIGGDGFLISTPFQRTSRRFINEVCEGLVPALQRRGLVREAYTRPTLRETLREF